MVQMPPLNNPWLVALWPGMGRVALTAGEYLAEQLRMRYIGEFPSQRFFELDHVTVHRGITKPGARPRCLLFLWKDPQGRQDIVVLLGEAQPDSGGYALCEQLAEQAREWGVSRVIAFAAMATQMHPSQPAQVFGAATDATVLAELTRYGVTSLQEGQISGLNGLMLAAAQEQKLEAACLLGELPYFAVQVANPKASRAVLDVFGRMMGLELDFALLDQHAERIDRQLTQLLERLQEGASSRSRRRRTRGSPFRGWRRSRGARVSRRRWTHRPSSASNRCSIRRIKIAPRRSSSSASWIGSAYSSSTKTAFWTCSNAGNDRHGGALSLRARCGRSGHRQSAPTEARGWSDGDG